jgi:hypothetical protein
LRSNNHGGDVVVPEEGRGAKRSAEEEPLNKR